ncbi:MAG: hypothetical protein DYG89_37755 [Caldilinea sp. CFX5]|nr:hypothetical protein [Caldilinea sp. CFX5]
MAIPTVWRTKKQRYSLAGAVCPTCNTTMFPPRKQCLQCNHAAANQTAGGNGEEYNYFMVFDLGQPLEVAVAGDD